MQPPVAVEPLGAVGLVVDVVCDLLQVLEVRPEGERAQETQSARHNGACVVSLPVLSLKGDMLYSQVCV